MTITPDLAELRAKTAFICDMDGVLYHGNHLLPGAAEFVDWLKAAGKRFLFLTNSSERSPRELRQKLARLGLDVSEEHFYTSAQNLLSAAMPKQVSVCRTESDSSGVVSRKAGRLNVQAPAATCSAAVWPKITLWSQP
jgi:ribonucleotide monophosphatase NagD (HAD superfamily)